MAFSFPFFCFALCPYSFLPNNRLALLNDGGSSLPYYFNASLPSRWLPSPSKERRLLTSILLNLLPTFQMVVLSFPTTADPPLQYTESSLFLPDRFFCLTYILLYFLHSFQMVDMPRWVLLTYTLSNLPFSFLPSLQMVAYPCPPMAAPFFHFTVPPSLLPDGCLALPEDGGSFLQAPA